MSILHSPSPIPSVDDIMYLEIANRSRNFCSDILLRHGKNLPTLKKLKSYLKIALCSNNVQENVDDRIIM